VALHGMPRAIPFAADALELFVPGALPILRESGTEAHLTRICGNSVPYGMETFGRSGVPLRSLPI
jgi:hypothetical protein